MEIDILPKDPMMLLSFVNTRLRDERITLAELAGQFGVSDAEIVKELDKIGYTYNNELNKFV